MRLRDWLDIGRMGDPSIMKIPTEHAEQVQVIAFLDKIAVLRWREFVMPDGRFAYFAIPNGGNRDAITGATMKREGVRSGVPDLMIPIPIGSKSGLFVEMKKQGRDTTTKELKARQEMWGLLLWELGYQWKVCHGAAEAISEIENYLKGKSK